MRKSETEQNRCVKRCATGVKGGFLGLGITIRSFRLPVVGPSILPPHKIINDGRPCLQCTTTL